MKKATVRDLRYRFRKVEDLLREGEEIQITKRKKVIAILVPPEPVVPSRCPDFHGAPEEDLRQSEYEGERSRTDPSRARQVLIAYADTSLLVSLYVLDANSAAAAAQIKKKVTPCRGAFSMASPSLTRLKLAVRESHEPT